MDKEDVRKGVRVCVRFPVCASSKEPTFNVGDLRDTGLITGLGTFPGGRYGNTFQYSCLENPMDRGAWRATESQT